MQTVMLFGITGLSRGCEALREANLPIQSAACRQTSPFCQGQNQSAALEPSLPECIPAWHDSCC